MIVLNRNVSLKDKVVDDLEITVRGNEQKEAASTLK